MAPIFRRNDTTPTSQDWLTTLISGIIAIVILGLIICAAFLWRWYVNPAFFPLDYVLC